MNAIEVPLETLIRQEILDAFDPNSGKIMGTGETIDMRLKAS
jgi:hypothetical protein